MVRIYGIPTCGSVKKAIAFIKARGIAHEFVDFRKTPATIETIDRWLKQVPIAALFNNKGTKYRTLGLAAQNLDDAARREWLTKENLLIKRPVIELEDGRVLVGFDETLYQQTF